MATETELKYLLSESAFRTLQKALGKPDKVAQQTNVYFDTARGALARRGMALRIRRIGASQTLTVKTKIAGRTTLGLSVREEYECRLSTQHAQLVGSAPSSPKLAKLEPWKKLLAALPPARIKELKRAASMHTCRSIYRMAAGVVLELDEVTLPNRTRFFEVELECRNTASARKFLRELFRTVGIRARPVRRTKLARVMRELRK